MIAQLLDQMYEYGDLPAVATGDATTTYAQLHATVAAWTQMLADAGVGAGDVVSVEGDYGPDTISALLAVVGQRGIVVPLSSDSQSQHDRFREIAAVQWRIICAGDGKIVRREAAQTPLPLYEQLREAERPGLVLFTSGSTGESKAAVHDVTLLLEKFQVQRQRLRTIVFLQLDHIGGVNTLLYTLANGGLAVAPTDRSPAAVCRAMTAHDVELLPTSPTFLNLLLLSEEYLKHDLSSLRLISYGTEPMPTSTLARLNEEFPQVKFKQTYGLTEMGILGSKSKDSQSLWMRLGGDGYETKVVDGRLWIRARSAMLGYLNAPAPFDEEGFYDTGDRVEVDGDWFRIIGRCSEIINVGGSKIFPAEVESVLLEMDGVEDAVAQGERHPLTGQVVSVTVCLAAPEQPAAFRTRLRQFCATRLPTYAIPARVRISDTPLHNSRFKRLRTEIKK